MPIKFRVEEALLDPEESIMPYILGSGYSFTTLTVYNHFDVTLILMELYFGRMTSGDAQ